MITNPYLIHFDGHRTKSIRKLEELKNIAESEMTWCKANDIETKTLENNLKKINEAIKNAT